MTTTTQTKAPIIQAKPTYSVVLYDPAIAEYASPTREQASELLALQSINDMENASLSPSIQAAREKRVTKKSQAERFKLKKQEFNDALLDLYRCGMAYDVAIAKINATILEPALNAVIPGLAKILGTYRAYFDNTNEVERAQLRKILVQKCRTDFGKASLVKSDKRTTEWHLLSRMFRQSDRRQASSDAKILKFAHAEGVTEESFASWVNKYGTLSNILKGIPAERAEEIPEKVKKAKPFLRWVTAAQVPDTDPQEALDALKKLADGKIYKIAIWHHHGRFDITREEAVPTTETDKKELLVDDANATETLDQKKRTNTFSNLVKE